jgi:hypothetical protein
MGRRDSEVLNLRIRQAKRDEGRFAAHRKIAAALFQTPLFALAQTAEAAFFKRRARRLRRMESDGDFLINEKSALLYAVSITDSIMCPIIARYALAISIFRFFCRFQADISTFRRYILIMYIFILYLIIQTARPMPEGAFCCHRAL